MIHYVTKHGTVTNVNDTEKCIHPGCKHTPAVGKVHGWLCDYHYSVQEAEIQRNGSVRIERTNT